MEAGCRRRTLLASFKGRRSRILVAGPCISLGNGGMPRSVDQFGSPRPDGTHDAHAFDQITRMFIFGSVCVIWASQVPD